MARRAPNLPQNDELVREFDKHLRRNVSQVRDYTRAFHRKWARRGVTTIRGTGWAVRPFLLPAAKLDFLAAAIHAGLTDLRNVMRQKAARRGEVSKALPFRRDFEDCVDVVDGVWSPAWLSHLRPDGYLFEDRFVLSEVNYGNGIIVSCAYTEAVADYWKQHPVLLKLGWDVERLHRRPFPWLLNVVRRFSRPVPKPRIALLAHSEEWKVIQGYPERVINQIHFARDALKGAGFRPRLVTETEVEVDRKGQLRFTKDGAGVDLLMFITIGSSFLDHPEWMRDGGPLAHFGQARIGDTWVLKPLAGLLVEKGALPLLGSLEGRFPARAHDGFRVEVSPTEFPYRQPTQRYTRRKDDWVIKRAFDGKDTHVGVARTPGEWRNVVNAVVQDTEYVAQKYVSLPRANVPVFVDEQHLEWVPSRVELSSFLFDGAFGGAAGRHAPDAEGLVMTDPPEDYGFTTVFSV